MVEDVQQRRREGERRPGLLALNGRGRGPEPQHDDPDVLDGVEGEQPLEVVLQERVEDAPQRRQHTQHRAAQARPGEPARPLEEHADQAVEGHLDHHARHQGRDVAGRDGMGPRQPGVQGHQARLGSETDDRGDHDQRLRAGALSGKRTGIAQRSVVGEREHGDPNADAAQVSHRQVDEDGPPDRGVAATHEDRGGRRQRHQLQQARNEDGSRAVTTPQG